MSDAISAEAFMAGHPGEVFTADVGGFTSGYGGILWYPLKPNPLPLWRRVLGQEMYVSADGKLVRRGESTAEGQW